MYNILVIIRYSDVAVSTCVVSHPTMHDADIAVKLMREGNHKLPSNVNLDLIKLY